MTDDIRAAATAALVEKRAEIMGDEPQLMGDFDEPEIQEDVQIPDETPEIPDETPDEPENKHLTYEEYIESGQDPKYYKGEEAFNQWRELVGDIKEQKRLNSELKETMFAITKFQEEQREQEQQKLLREKAHLEQQIAEIQQNGVYDQEGFNKYEALKERVGQIDNQTAKPEQQQGEHEIFRKAREAEPKLNFNHPDFDPDYNALVESRTNQSIMEAMQRNGGSPLSDNELATHLSKAKEYVDKKFAEQKPKHQRVPENPPAKSTPKNAIPDVIAQQIRKWENSNDPSKRESARAWKLKYGVK